MDQSIVFALVEGPHQARFDGPQLTSDGGLCRLAEADAALGLCAALAAQIPAWRQGPVRHALETLVRQRDFQIACGYQDQNDAATPRSGPLLKLVWGRGPAAVADVARQPTLSRFRWLFDNDLVDEMTLFICPVVVGQGTRLFPDTGRDWTLDLVASRATPSGMTIQVYRPAGRSQDASGTADRRT